MAKTFSQSFINTKPATSPVTVRQASSPADVAAIVECFRVYTTWLDEDLTYQNYAAELNGLPGKYAPPTGALLLAVDATTDTVLGCIALRPIEIALEYRRSHLNNRRYCELKRLFVYPEARGRQVARSLVREALKRAVSEGYDEALLDTLSRMKAAISLYKAEGFTETEPYYASPLHGTIYFTKKLRLEKRADGY